MTPGYVGIDIGGTHIRALREVDGQRGDITQKSVAKDFAGLVRDIVALAGDTPVTGVGIALPGRVIDNTAEWIPNLSFLEDHDLVKALADHTDATITLINDAQAALIAESHEGAAQGCSDVALVAIGTGIGGAMLLDGRLIRGHTGTTGSFGWMSQRHSQPGRLDPEIGPWETAASGTALLRLISAWGSVDDFVSALDHGDDAARRVASDYSDELVPGFAAIASCFDPEKIVVVGGVSVIFPHILEHLRHGIRALASPTGRHVDITVGTLGPRASTIGALLIGQGAYR